MASRRAPWTSSASRAEIGLPTMSIIDELGKNLTPLLNEETSITLSGRFEETAYGEGLRRSFDEALALRTKLPEWIRTMPGMSGRKYRCLINNLIGRLADARYLEVGSWAGSTACSAIYGNRVRALCIDNWSEFDGPKAEFQQNVAR